MHPLDNPFWHALSGPQQPWSEGDGPARRYLPAAAPFAALESPSPDAWAALAELLGPGSAAALFAPEPLEVPPGWTVLNRFPILQMVADELRTLPERSGAQVVPLTSEDHPAIKTLVTLTRPGPFRPRTAELGAYFGVWDGPELIALAGERARLPGWCEVSAVCVHPAAQRRGLGAAVVRRVMEGMGARGETPFLHVVPDNAAAIGLYERLGFRVRAQLAGTVVTRG